MNRSSVEGMPSFRTPPPIRLRDFHPSNRLRLVGPTQQLFPDGWPVLFQVAGDFIDGHPIDACTTFISLHPPQCFLQVFSLTYFLHQSIRAGWAFGSMYRRERFGLFPSRFVGFTRWRGREVQFSLDVLLRVALETQNTRGPRTLTGTSYCKPMAQAGRAQTGAI